MVKQFKSYNSIFGWIVFLIAAFTYISTAEATASLWDCSEFIATSFKLEVGHPPGDPMFALMARFFTLLAGSNLTLVARMVNYMSALASAFTILLLFWTITHLARKIIIKGDNFTKSNIAIILGSGLVGSLAYTFSDSFWFSAVEGEVYASSSLFTALVFWAILKWEDVADEKYSNRWIILIAYLMGLSIGVHLLNLLAIPAIVMVYYFRKFKIELKGVVIALVLSIVILGIVMYGIVQGIVKVASWIELYSVNTLSFPFNIGILFFILILLAIILYGIYYSTKNHRVILNTVCLSIIMLLLGYASFALVVIRSSADTPINEDKPDNVFSLLSYINREQYGDRPLFWGQYYNTPVKEYIEDGNIYLPIGKKYEVVSHNYKVNYDSSLCTFFPRMYSSDQNHINEYKSWGNIVGRPIDVEENGKLKTIYMPTFSENLKFFIKYQIGYMYMRYLLWNFVGRQNDEEGGGITKGNWISGINFIDYAQIGPQKNIPSSLRNVPSRSAYFGLPFLLGILGFLFLIDKSKRYFLVTLLLFLMTGLAIVVYLNQTPLQPRERDYAYVGSFYVFAIWIGFGVLFINSLFKKEKLAFIRTITISILCIALVPSIMAKENWRNHDRSGRYTTRAFAYDYLNSCAPNAILFTFGDNDTFPLWYLQEVEGIRTDVRVVNTMLFSMDWYFDQMKKKAYESEPLPISLEKNQYMGDKRNRVYIIDQIKDYVDLKQALDFVASDDPKTKSVNGYEQIDYLPGRNFLIPVNKEVVLNSGTVDPKNADKIVNEIKFTIRGNGIDKGQLGVLDIIAHNGWKRPIYFVSTNNEGTVGLDQYLQLEGFAYRLVPVKTSYTSTIDCGRIETGIMFNNLMNKFVYGRINEPDVYIDNFHRRTLSVLRFRNSFTRLASALIEENKKDSAIAVLDKCQLLTPSRVLPDDLFSIGIAEAYLAAGDTTKGINIMKNYYQTCVEELNYYFSLSSRFQNSAINEINYNLEALNQMQQVCGRYKLSMQKDISIKLKEFNTIYNSGNSSQ